MRHREKLRQDMREKEREKRKKLKTQEIEDKKEKEKDPTEVNVYGFIWALPLKSDKNLCSLPKCISGYR